MSRTEDRSDDTLLNALVGAAASVVLAFVPFSSILGGGVAGYLQRGDYAEGATVGAIAGFLAMVPFVLFFVFVGGVMTLGMVGIPRGALVFGGAGVLALLFFVGIYVVGLSILGGIVGVYIAEETEIGG